MFFEERACYAARIPKASERHCAAGGGCLILPLPVGSIDLLVFSMWPRRRYAGFQEQKSCAGSATADLCGVICKRLRQESVEHQCRQIGLPRRCYLDHRALAWE